MKGHLAALGAVTAIALSGCTSDHDALPTAAGSAKSAFPATPTSVSPPPGAMLEAPTEGVALFGNLSDGALYRFSLSANGGARQIGRVPVPAIAAVLAVTEGRMLVQYYEPPRALPACKGPRGCGSAMIAGPMQLEWIESDGTITPIKGGTNSSNAIPVPGSNDLVVATGVKSTDGKHTVTSFRVLHPDGSFRELFHAIRTEQNRMSLSPDGKTLLVPTGNPDDGKRGEVIASNLATGGKRSLVYGGGSIQVTNVKWSPDGTRVALVTQTNRLVGDTSVPSYKIAVAGPNGGPFVRITGNLGGQTALWTSNNELLFTQPGYVGGYGLLDADTGRTRRVTGLELFPYPVIQPLFPA